MIFRAGNFQMIALQATPFLFNLSDPSKVATRRVSSSSKVGIGLLIVFFGCFCGETAISNSYTPSRGVIQPFSVQSTSASLFSHRGISSVQFEIKADHLPNLPLRLEDCNNQFNVAYRLSTVISRETSIL